MMVVPVISMFPLPVKNVINPSTFKVSIDISFNACRNSSIETLNLPLNKNLKASITIAELTFTPILRRNSGKSITAFFIDKVFHQVDSHQITLFYSNTSLARLACQSVLKELTGGTD